MLASVVIWRNCRDDVRSVRLGGMTGSLRLSALLLLLLSRWASADLEKGEDEYVRSWVIIEEQLVPPSRDELLATGGAGTAGGGVSGGGVAGRRITPKSVFVAPSFNKCSDGYRPDSMGRCVKVVKINQAAQWDFLIKQLNSMYGSGGSGVGFPMLPGASAYQPATTTTTEPPSQKTDSPGPFQLNIPLAGSGVVDPDNQTMDPVDELTTATTTTAGTTTAGTTTTNPTTTTTKTTTTTTSTAASTTVEDDDVATTDRPVTTTVDGDPDDDRTTVTATAVTTADAADTVRPRPYRNRYQTTHAEDAITVTPPSYDSTTIATYTKTKYADNSKTTIAETEDPSYQTFKTTGGASLSSSFSSPVVTTTAVDVTETDNPATAATPLETEEEDVVTVLAVAAVNGGDGDSSRPVSTTRLPYTTGGSRTQSPVADTVTPEYYDDQPEEPTSSPEPDCSAPDAYRFYAACAGFRQQQQFEQLQQQQQLLHQHQQQQQLYQQQQQQFYHQQQQQHNHMAAELVKRPSAAGGGAQVRFPGDEDPVSATSSDSANLIRFPGPAPYRTTNKMYESSRHPTWWPTGWPDQQQQQQQLQLQQQYPDDSVQQQHRLQHHLPQQKQDVRLWEFGSRLPKTTSTTTAVPAPPTQWYHRFF
ncbi:AF4/FMR2 family member 4-like [Aphis craccivora]|uniref:AF4/FMR2 family member 4-like n=1 Tax=Aphis craccivora TaxID=307492 RepID=A0A6G0ZBE4_APHCR|nr:AF4/FMR2 family member 4-like [Aphis craccivora]